MTRIINILLGVVLLASVACRHSTPLGIIDNADEVIVDMRGESTATVDEANIAIDFGAVGTVTPIEGVSEQLLTRRSYIASYNANTRCPNWVAWRLTAEHTDGPFTRKGRKFQEDDDVPLPRATNADYRGSGWSRGHLCPAGDNKWDSIAMDRTFLLSNVCPQTENLNSGVWNQIEISTRKWAARYGEVYVITGPMYFKSNERQYIGEDSVVVPDAFFKVILRLGDDPQAIGFVCRNNDNHRHKDAYVYSLSQVERVTGLHFFPDLTVSVRDSIATGADLNRWE